MECGLQRHERKTWLIKHHLKMMTSFFCEKFQVGRYHPSSPKPWGQSMEFQFSKLSVSRNLALNAHIPIKEPRGCEYSWGAVACSLYQQLA